MPSQTFKSVKIYKNCIEGNRRQVYKGKNVRMMHVSTHRGQANTRTNYKTGTEKKSKYSPTL